MNQISIMLNYAIFNYSRYLKGFIKILQEFAIQVNFLKITTNLQRFTEILMIFINFLPSAGIYDLRDFFRHLSFAFE